MSTRRYPARCSSSGTSVSVRARPPNESFRSRNDEPPFGPVVGIFLGVLTAIAAAAVCSRVYGPRVTPIIGGKAVKGPTVKIMEELGLSADIGTIARHYSGVIDGFVIDHEDAHHEAALALPTLATNTMMMTLEDKIGLARAAIAMCGRLRSASIAQPAKAQDA